MVRRKLECNEFVLADVLIAGKNYKGRFADVETIMVKETLQVQFEIEINICISPFVSEYIGLEREL